MNDILKDELRIINNKVEIFKPKHYKKMQLIMAFLACFTGIILGILLLCFFSSFKFIIFILVVIYVFIVISSTKNALKKYEENGFKVLSITSEGIESLEFYSSYFLPYSLIQKIEDKSFFCDFSSDGSGVSGWDDKIEITISNINKFKEISGNKNNYRYLVGNKIFMTPRLTHENHIILYNKISEFYNNYISNR